MNPEQWLNAARTGGAPEPVRERWQPLRVGIVNLWEYDDAEFWFADGRLVLRGGNGTGKTKILELTTLMLLRGEIMPSVLDPFGSQHRTMRFNLLPTGEEDDPRPPADSGLGYAWAEFGRVGEGGAPQYLTCGLGASARRGSGTESPRRWMFLTPRRPGPDLVLAPATGPLDEKDLRKQPDVRVFDNGARYRAELARELFDLDAAAYDNLTELLKQLRRPKLGERLNPAELARTLRDALPRLAAGEVDQLVEGWDRLEDLRRGVEQLEESALAVAGFTRRHWLPWARTVVRRRADELSTATTQLDNTTRDRKDAEQRLEAARKKVAGTGEELVRRRAERTDRRTELDELINSSAYRDAVAATARAESLRREADRQARDAEAARNAVEAAERRLGAARTAHESAAADHDEARRAVDARVAAVRGHADAAGLGVADPHDIPALRAAHGLRSERLGHLDELLRTWRTADAKVEKAAGLVEEREATAGRLHEAVRAAEGDVVTEAETLAAELDTWVRNLRAAPATGEQVSGWHDLIAELGTPGAGPRLADALRDHLDVARGRMGDREADLRLRMRPLQETRGSIEERLAEIRSAAEQPPPPPVLWGRRDRTSAGGGAPLWACVRPRDDADEATLARLEAALAASGLLDAWITPDGALRAGEDTFAVAGRPAGGSLLRVVEPAPTGGLPAERIAAVLAGIGWFPEPPSGGAGPRTGDTRRTPSDGEAGGRPEVWLAADGSWCAGLLTGRARPVQPASYLGATARARARQRAIDRLAAELTETVARIDALDGELARVRELVQRLGEERATIPREQGLLSAVTRLVTVREQCQTAERSLGEARDRHESALAERDDARARASSYAAEHGFPAGDLEPVRRGLAGFLNELNRLEGELRLLAVHAGQVEAARAALHEAADELEEARSAAVQAEGQARQAAIAAETARTSLGADRRAQLHRKEELEAAVTGLETAVERLTGELTDLKVEANSAEQVLERHEEARRQAEQRRDAAIAAWWEAADHGLIAPLGLPVPENRSVEATREAARVARRQLTVQADERAQENAWRRCHEKLQELRQTLLPNRDAQIRQEDDDPLPRIVVLTDPASGWLPPDEADEALAGQVVRQRARYDAEQQQVLTKLLGSTFIEHLKDRLDYTESVFTRINAVLAKHPTRQGHALQLVWEADPADADAGQVVEALRQGYEHLAEDRQEMVREFLKRRIDGAREDAEAQGLADWREHLAGALDYRGWLRIRLQFRPGSTSRWRPFDAARHGSKSGGEKVVLLSQPLFAAAVVAYDAAGPAAPRMVWLDEAMTGVDNEVKATFMGLTVELDLDVMLTAHDEWCTYATVPAVAVYDLARRRYVPGVDAMPYLWCGGMLEEAGTTLAARPREADALAEEGTLFADDRADD